MSRETGAVIAGLDHLRQSIADILTTRIGTRVMLRHYGSDIPDLLDRPVNASWITGFVAAVAVALGTWEPRILLRRVTDLNLDNLPNGQVTMTLLAWYKPGGYFIRLDNLLLDFTL